MCIRDAQNVHVVYCAFNTEPLEGANVHVFNRTKSQGFKHNNHAICLFLVKIEACADQQFSLNSIGQTHTKKKYNCFQRLLTLSGMNYDNLSQFIALKAWQTIFTPIFTFHFALEWTSEVVTVYRVTHYCPLCRGLCEMLFHSCPLWWPQCMKGLNIFIRCIT